MSGFSQNFSNETYLVAGAGGVQMTMLVRDRREYFTDFIERQAKAKGLKVVLNGSYIDLAFGSAVAVRLGSSALDPAESMPTGQVIQDGLLLAGTSSSGKFNFSQDTCGVAKFSAGLGNPPASACSAIGGIAPIIIDGLAYGAQNAYKAKVPAGAPLTGDVVAKFRPFLIQKSNAMFSKLLSLGNTVGKVALGYSSSNQSLLMMVQPHGKSGMNANTIRAVFVANKITNAVFLDCSDSATLYYDGKFLVRPGTDKNEFLSVAIGFK